MEVTSTASILSQITGIANINHGYVVTTTTHELVNGAITSYTHSYTVYDASAALTDDHTPRYGLHIDTRV